MARVRYTDMAMGTATTTIDRMPTDPKTTPSPRRRESTTPSGARAESCVDPSLRGDDGGHGDGVEGGWYGRTSQTLARLMTWLSPAYPVGAYSYSHGLEWVVEAGKVKDAAGLGSWIEDVLLHGA